MQNTHSVKFLRKRKFLLVLPFLTLPFVTVAFWLMGGGSAKASSTGNSANTGLNLELPEAKFSDEDTRDKLSFYDQAQEDSIRLRQEMLNDPYYKNRLDTMPLPVNISVQQSQSADPGKLNTSPYHSSGATNPAETKIYERLNALNKALQSTPSNKNESLSGSSQISSTDLSGDLNRLENMMQVMNEGNADDPEMKELNGMLDKILDIQHPERVKSRIKEKPAEKKTGVFSISNSKNDVAPSYLGTRRDTIKRNSNAFYGEAFKEPEESNSNAVSAVIHETQNATAGSTVKMRLTTDIYVNGTLVPKGSFVYGIASLENERLLLSISVIRYKQNLLPVSLTVYDMDGLQGIYAPGSLSRDVVKSSADQSLQSIDLMPLDPSLKAQVAAAGIQTAKGLLSRKTKVIKVTLKAGYKVLLRDGNKQDK